MKFLFIFAHPDDESVACAGTLKQLADGGHETIVWSVTDGAAGELKDSVREQYPELSVSEIRRQEFENACTHLGVATALLGQYQDGHITNQLVWGQLKADVIEMIERHQPDFVITFDHTGWYFHLDHVGVSIATTWAVMEAQHQVQGLLLSHFRPGPGKWQYAYNPHLPVTHQVEVADTQHKLQALDQHASQELGTPRQYIREQHPQLEYYQLTKAQPAAEPKLAHTGVFLKLSD